MLIGVGVLGVAAVLLAAVTMRRMRLIDALRNE